MDETIISTCAGCIVFDLFGLDFKVLLVKSKKSNSWGIPKGHIEEFETLEQCAIRETFEETGVLADPIIELPPVSTKIEHGMKQVTFFVSGRKNPWSEVIPQAAEIAEAKFFSLDALPEVASYQQPALHTAVEMVRRNA